MAVYVACQIYEVELFQRQPEIKLGAERKAGEFLKEMPKAKGGEQYHPLPSIQKLKS